MTTESTPTDTARSLKIIAFMSACVAFMLIGGAVYLKYRTWTGKDRIANAKSIADVTRAGIERETNVDKLRSTAVQYYQAYLERGDQADFTKNEIGNIALAASMFPLLILIRIANDLKRLNNRSRPV